MGSILVMQGAVGGVANESGSNHRSVGAALIAVYGLNGKSVPWLGEDAWPVSIGLETDNAVDDIEVTLSDGRRVHIQAKSTCGLDSSFEKSAAQWAASAKTGEAASVSRFVLLVSNPTGTLKDLREALHHWRADSTLPKREEKALNSAIKTLTTKHSLSRDEAESILRKVFVAILDTNPSGQALELGAALLDTGVVAAGQGTAALGILTNFFHDNSRQRKPSGLNDWRSVLRTAKVPVHSDPNGVLAARLQAEDEEVASYRQNLATTKDEVDFYSLDLEVEKFIRPKCSRGLRVRPLDPSKSRRPHEDLPLLDLARRQGRFILIGTPGVGKTFSLKQIAANFADQPNAPLPLLLRLRDVSTSLRKLPPASTWGFKEIAQYLAPGNEVLEAALLARMRQGDVVYLFDGLDEVANVQSEIVSWIGKLVRSLAPHTDIVISSRHSAAQRAHLDLPQFELQPPTDDGLTDDVLVKFAERIPVEGGERAEWLQSRRALVRRARAHDRELWSVPLLALLMVSILVSRGPEGLPKSRSGLLRAAIEVSVGRWEMKRISGIEAGLPKEYQPQIVLDAFADIAGVVAKEGRWADAMDAVVARLPKWDVPALAARSWAAAILNFWDATAAVFVTTTEEGVLTARSRLFTEIGVAMLLNRDETAMKAWVETNKSDADSYETMRLLCGLDSKAMNWMAELAIQGSPELVDVILDAVDEGAEIDQAVLGPLLDHELARLPGLLHGGDSDSQETVGAESPETEEGDGIVTFGKGPVDDAYRLAVRISQYSLSPAQDASVRAFALSELAPPQRSILLAVREIQSPEYPIDSDLHWQIIACALPPKPDRSRKEGYVSPWKEIDTWGLHTVTRYAAERLTSDRGALAIRVLAAAHMGGIYDAIDVHSLLTAKGFGQDFELLNFALGFDAFANLPKSFKTEDQPVKLLLDCLGDPAESENSDLWHLNEASAAFALLHVTDVAFGSIYWAADSYPELAAALAQKMVDDSNLEVGAVAAQLDVVAKLGREGSLLLYIPSDRTPDTLLTPTDGWEELIMDAWKTGNEWLGLQALSVSVAAEGFTDEFLNALSETLSELPPNSRRLVGKAVEYHRPGETWLLSDSRALAGVRRIQAGRAWEAGDYRSLVAYLQDADLTIRNVAVPDCALPHQLKELLPVKLPRPERWSCRKCGNYQDLTEKSCPCGGKRPADELDKLL